MKDPVAVRNERVKMFAGFVNVLGLGLIGFAVLRPLTETPMTVSGLSAWWGLTGLALHGLSHYILRYLRKAPDR